MPRTAITIGTFDGVHLGHRALLTRAREVADRVIVLAFDPHPAAALRPDAVPARLSTWTQRERRLREAGAASVARLTPDAATLAMSPEQFVERLAREYSPTVLVEGADFRFGRGASGDVRALAALGARFGFAVEVVEPVTTSLADQSIVTVSSTLVRWLVERGRAQDAAALLGRPHELVGTVVRGDRRGREIGFPTANLETPCLAPGDGVYAGRAELPDGRVLPAAISVGTKPTFDGRGRAVEAFLLGAERDADGAIAGLPEYGWTMRLEVSAWVREQVRFGSIADLVDQMERDCARVDNVIGEHARTGVR